VIDVLGIKRNDGKENEESNFFNDLNYGDMVMTFPNPLYDFMLDEVLIKETLIKK
jgi:hypothetical protein